MTIEVCRCTRRRELTRLHFTSKWKGPYSLKAFLFTVIIKTTIPLIMIGLKNSCFPLILLTSCYQTVCYRTVQEANHIQSCSLNQLNKIFFFRSYFQLLVSVVLLAARISQIRFFTAVQIYEFHISKIIIHHLDGIFRPNILLKSQLVERCTEIAEVMVQVPYESEFFFFPGPIFNYSFQ